MASERDSKVERDAPDVIGRIARGRLRSAPSEPTLAELIARARAEDARVLADLYPQITAALLDVAEAAKGCIDPEASAAPLEMALARLREAMKEALDA